MGLENPVHWVIVAIIALIVLGPKRLPDAGRALGSGIREFKESISGGGSHDSGGKIEADAHVGEDPGELSDAPERAAGRPSSAEPPAAEPPV